MNLVLNKLRKEKHSCKVDISHCKYILKVEGQDLAIKKIYTRSMRHSEKYLSQIENAINILKGRE